MATTYRDASEEVHGLLASVIEEYFLDLAAMEPELQIDIRMATAAKKGKPALKKGGNPCAALISIVKAEERSAGGPDIRIKIDKCVWMREGEEGRKALLHHELSHIVPKKEKDSDILKLDDYGRPVVKLKPDDWALTGFRETVRIFGEKALERKSLDAVEEMLDQRSLPFGEAALTGPALAAV